MVPPRGTKQYLQTPVAVVTEKITGEYCLVSVIFINFSLLFYSISNRSGELSCKLPVITDASACLVIIINDTLHWLLMMTFIQRCQNDTLESVGLETG